MEVGSKVYTKDCLQRDIRLPRQGYFGNIAELPSRAEANEKNLGMKGLYTVKPASSSLQLSLGKPRMCCVKLEIILILLLNH